MKARRFDFYADDWLGGTLELSPYDRGIYITICALIYSRGEKIEFELIRRHCGVHVRALNAAINRLQKAGKICGSDGYMWNERCLEEISSTRLRMELGAQNKPQSGKNKELSGFHARTRARSITTTNKESLEDSSSDLVRADARLEGQTVAVDQLVAETIASLKNKPDRPHVGKRDQWLNNLASFVSEAFDGEARMEAWQAIEDARAAGSRDATPQHVRNAIDRIDKLYRTAHAMEAAA